MILKNGKRIDGCSDTVPIGSLNPFIGTTAPFGYLLCQGQLVSKTTYPELYAICGDTFGTATQDEFYLPDLRGQTIAGYKEGDSTFGTLGGLIGNKTISYTPTGTNTGGAVQSHTLTTNEIPAHDHSVDNITIWGDGFWVGSGGYTTLTFGSRTTSSAGGGQGHSHGFTQPTFTGTQADIDVVQPTITLNWIVKAIKLMPNQSTVVNVQSNSPTDVYSCAYINNLPSGGSGDERYIDANTLNGLIYAAPLDVQTSITDPTMIANFKDILKTATVDTKFIYGEKSSSTYTDESLYHLRYEEGSGYKDLGFVFDDITTDYFAYVSATYSITNDNISNAYIYKYSKASTGLSSTTLNLNNTPILLASRYIQTSADKNAIASLVTSLQTTPVDIVYIKDSLGKTYQAAYSISTDSYMTTFTLSFDYGLGYIGEITYRDYGGSTDYYMYINARSDNLDYAMTYMDNEKYSKLVIDPYERIYSSTYWGGTSNDDSIYNPQQHDVGGGFQWNSNNNRFETAAMNSSTGTISSELQVYNPEWNYNDSMSIELNCYQSGTLIPPLELELYINGELVGARTANANDSQGISLSYNNLQSNDVIKVVAKSISSTVSNTYAYISFQTYPRIATIATTGTETDFKNNLKSWCQTIIYNKDKLDNYITLVKIPDIENSPYNYNTILAEALLINYNYFISQDSQNRDIYNFNIKSLPFEYNYSPCYFHIEFTYKDWDYSNPIDITSMYISTMGIDPEYAYSKFSMLDTIMDDYYGPTLSWTNYDTYLMYSNSFTSLKITNTMTWSTIKLTIDSQDLVNPLVTTLSQGQSLTLDDVGITYDSIRAEYNTTTTESLYDIVSALHAKIDYTGETIQGNLNITGAYQINGSNVIWDE